MSAPRHISCRGRVSFLHRSYPGHDLMRRGAGKLSFDKLLELKCVSSRFRTYSIIIMISITLEQVVFLGISLIAYLFISHRKKLTLIPYSNKQQLISIISLQLSLWHFSSSVPWNFTDFHKSKGSIRSY